MRCGIPNAYILDITVYKMHVSLRSYYTIKILVYKILTGTCEGGYTFVFEMYFECFLSDLPFFTDADYLPLTKKNSMI